MEIVGSNGATATLAWKKHTPQKTINQLRSEKGPETVQPVAPQQGDELNQKVQELDEKVGRVAEAQTKSFPSISNPALGMVGETIFSYRSKGSEQTGSDRPGGYDIFQRSVELDVAASIDPFARGYAVFNASADAATGEANVGVEEAALQTTSLPANLTLKAGRFFAEFGRISYIHDHELPMVNRPLVLDQYVGGESRTDGAQLNWLLPSEHYVSLTAGVGDQFGGDSPNPNNVGGSRHFSGLNFWTRLSTFFELSPDLTLEPGFSAVWNPKTLDRGGFLTQPDGSALVERERRLAGADLVLTYKPLANNQFNSLIWGTEFLYSSNRFDSYDLTDPNSPLLSSSRYENSRGLYSYLTYRFHREWSAGFNFDWVQNYQNHHAETFAYSPNITWAISHWNQLRLQYTYTDYNAAAEGYGLQPDHAVYLQWAWIIGAHAHGWQQR